MNFLKPTSLYLLLLIPLLLLLYMLRLRRNTYVVSSCLFWDQAIEDMKANTPFQRLRKNLLLPLQIMFLALSIFALARPFLSGRTGSGQDFILIMDGSASMQARDSGKTRFEEAVSAAVKMADDLRNSERMMIIESTSSTKIISDFTSDKLRLREALRKMQPADTSTDLSGAIQLASSIAKDAPRSEIFLLSDGAAELPESALPFKDRIRFVGLGKEDSQNVGITAFEMGQSPVNPSEIQMFVALQNFGRAEKQHILLELYGDNNLLDVRELSLMPDEKRSVVFDGLGYVEGTMKAVIEVDDDLDTDNQAYYVLNKPDTLEVLLVSQGNLFLEEAIRTASSRIRLSREAPEEYSSDERYNIVVLDGFVPNVFPTKNALFVNPEANLPFKMLSTYNNPTIIDWDRSHPVMRFVDLSALRIDRSYSYQMPAWMKPLVESDMGTIIWLGEHTDQRIMVLPFEIKPRPSSNFPMLTAFPIFMSNTLNWLAGDDVGSARKQFKTGTPLRASLPKTVSQVIVGRPDGEETEIPVKNGTMVYNDTDKAGIYEVIGEGFTEKFAVNLLDESESNIKPSDKIELSGQEIVSTSISATSNREIRGSLILLALMLLAVEWFVYHRRILV